MLVVFRDHAGTLVVGMMVVARDVRAVLPDDSVRAVAGARPRSATAARQFLLMQLFGVLFFALTIPIVGDARRARPPAHADLGDGRRSSLFGLVMAPLFVAGTAGAVLTMAIGLSLMGMTYGPIGTVLSNCFRHRCATRAVR